MSAIKLDNLKDYDQQIKFVSLGHFNKSKQLKFSMAVLQAKKPDNEKAFNLTFQVSDHNCSLNNRLWTEPIFHGKIILNHHSEQELSLEKLVFITCCNFGSAEQFMDPVLDFRSCIK